MNALPPDSAPVAAADAPVAPRPRTLRRVGLVLAGLLLLALLVSGSGVRWLLGSEAGARWLLAQLPGAEVSGLEGRLLGDRLRATRLVLKAGTRTITLDEVEVQGLRWRLRPQPAVWVAVEIETASARAVRVAGEPAPPGPPPTALQFPVQLRVGQVSVGTLQIDALPTVSALTARGLVLDSAGEGAHAVEQLALQVQGLAISGQARIGAAAPLPLQAEARIAPVGPADAGRAPAWAAAVQARGPLALLELSATLRGLPQEGGPAPALDLQARLDTFSAWPLSTLRLRTEALDLSTLAPGLPRTRLSGQGEVQARALDAPITADLRLDNALPGRWDQGRLPARRLRLQLSGQASDRSRVDVPRFEFELADAQGSAGRWSGQAQWLAHGLRVDTRLEGVQPQRLDRRAAAMRLSGPLALTLAGLPSPDPAAAAPTEPLQGRLTLQLDGQLAQAPLPVRVSLQASGNAGQIDIERARAQAGSAVADLRARLRRRDGLRPPPAGAAAGADYEIETSGSLFEFDLLPWWPGEPGSTWARGPHRLSAGWQLALRLPGNALRLGGAALAHRVAGNGTLNVHDAVLAGVPLQADLRLGWTPGPASRNAPRTAAAAAASAPATAPAGAAGSLDLALVLGGNRLVLAGQGDPAGSGSNDRWQLELQAGSLAALAPLARLHPALADWLPRRGSLDATGTLSGRWPEVQGEGQARIRQLQAGALAIDSADARWRLDGGGEQRVALQTEASAISFEGRRIEQLQARIDGTRAAHRIAAQATVRQTPGPMLEQVLAVQAQQGTRALLLADGGWRPEPGGGGRWKARIERLAVEAWDGSAAPAPVALSSVQTLATAATLAAPATAPVPAAASPAGTPAARGGNGTNGTKATPAPNAAHGANGANGARNGSNGARNAVRNGARNGSPAGSSWAEARGVEVELQFGADGGLQQAQTSAGRLRLADVATLRWDEAALDLRGPRPGIRLRAEVEPFAVAPLLARAQPGTGWAGNLTVGARLAVRAAERMEVDMTVERVDGDLNLDGESGLLLFGLSDVRLALMARDGVWAFRQAFRGRSIGEFGTNLRVRSRPENRWPEADDPMEGVLEARVADIGVWSSWVPPGWRLAGSLLTKATIGGRFSQPTFTGDVTGSGLGVRNLLQGVNLSDGTIAVKLEGDNARIEKFTLKGGEGTLAITGNASLVRNPRADLALTAERFRVIGRVDRQLTASGQATLGLAGSRLKLDGALRVDEGLFDTSRSDAPSLDDDVTVRRTAERPTEAEAAPLPRTRRNVDLGLDVDLGERLVVRGRGLDTTLRGKLRITTPGGQLTVVGPVSTERGTYAAYGQKLEIERGIITFTGAPDNPRLDVLALRPNIDIRVGVAISGNALTPRVRLVSEPEMAETDKLSWLVLGRAPDGLGRTDTALLQRAAVALLAGEGEAPSDQLMRNLGIDDLSLRQTEGDTRETVITLGKQLGRRWYLGYERGVNATTGTWQLIYRVAQRLTVRAQSGLESSLDIIWIWRVGEADESAVTKSVVTTPP